MNTGNINNMECGFCGEDIEAGSRRCPYCGSLQEVKHDVSRSAQRDLFTAHHNEGLNDRLSNNSEPDNDDVNTGLDTSLSENMNSNKPVIDNSSKLRPETAAHASYEAEGRTNSISNSVKVLLTILCTVIPGLGQLAGIIISIIFINSDNDDKRSFGTALMIGCLIVFILSFILFFLLLSVAVGFMNAYKG